jgi:GNAT superfamily N-acetyltransferase
VDPKPQIAKLAVADDTSSFDCGSEPLDRYLKLHALQSQRANSAQTYVAAVNEQIVGYYTLVVGSVTHGDAPDRLRRGLPRHPIPIVFLARLAIDRSWQGKGLASALLLDAIRRVFQIADLADVRAIAVHAKDENASHFYEHFGFAPFPEQPLTLYCLLKDLRAMSEG